MSEPLSAVLSPPASGEAPGRRAARRRRGKSGWLVLVPLLITAGMYAALHYAARKDLESVIAELDRSEPDGWRLEELEAKRPNVPDERNAALQIIATRKLFPPKWPAVGQNQLSPFLDLLPEVQLTGRQAAELSLDFRQGQGARVVAEARKLADMPDGRFSVRWSEDWISTRLEDEQHARSVMSVLGYDAVLRGHEGDADGACRSCLGILNVSRSVRDDPTVIAFLIRCAGEGIAVARIERVLAQGQPSEAALAELQHALEREARELSMRTAVRGERAGLDRICLAIQAGKLPIAEVSVMAGGNWTAAQNFFATLAAGTMERNRAAALRYMTRAVEITGLPLEQEVAAFRLLEADLSRQPMLLRQLVAALGKIAEAHVRHQAWLRAAAVAVAAERFRRRHGRWPERIEELTPAWLAQVPTDPYDGEPLRFRRLADGLVVYSIGPNGTDDGGDTARKPNSPLSADLGLRLWDVGRRRQPPRSSPRP